MKMRCGYVISCTCSADNTFQSGEMSAEVDFMSVVPEDTSRRQTRGMEMTEMGKEKDGCLGFLFQVEKKNSCQQH